jgi:16S rRNA (uracil1498-N3)-methyltransferase
MHIFYTPDLDSSNYVLNHEESKHCVKVLRLKDGDTVNLMNGKGSLFVAKIIDANHKGCELQIISEKNEFGKRSYRVVVAIAPTKNTDRFEWFLEKATEIGIDEIIPIICQHSERKDIKTDRLEKVIISAMKQSYKAYLPVLSEPIPFRTLINKYFDGKKFIAHCEEGEKKLLKNLITPQKDVLILIGPEGDFSKDEIDEAINCGFVPVSLGDSRLRTETAGIVACHTVNLINQ